MDREETLATAFMVFGLGFFILMIGIIVFASWMTENHRTRQDDKNYERRLNEMREFGYKTATKVSRQLHPHEPKRPRKMFGR